MVNAGPKGAEGMDIHSATQQHTAQRQQWFEASNEPWVTTRRQEKFKHQLDGGRPWGPPNGTVRRSAKVEQP
jgi:hypothetical protein